MISNLLSFTAFLHGVLVSYGAFVCVLLKDLAFPIATMFAHLLFATKVIHGIMVPSFFCISKVFVWKCVWPLSLSLYLSPLFLSVVPRHMSSDALYPIFSSWSILLFYIMSFHSSFKIHQQNSPTIHRLSFTTTILRAAWNTSFSLSGQPSSSSFFT